MTDKAQRILLGRITTAHGIRGDVVIDSYASDPADIAAYGPLQSADGSREYVVKVVRVTPKGVVAHIKGVDDRNGAEALRGVELFIERAKMPAADEGEFYYADLEGLRVENEGGETIGTVVAVHNFGAGDLLEVRLGDGPGTELISFTDAFVPVVDVPAGRVVVVLPPATPEDEEEPG
jgi:16S rRNA processing protein RimM